MIGTQEMNGYITFKAPNNNLGISEISYNELTKKIRAFWDGDTVKNSQNIKEMEEVNTFVMKAVLEHQKQERREINDLESDLESLAHLFGEQMSKEKEKAEQTTHFSTLEEVFLQKYDLNDIAENSFALWDAIGFLKGIKYLAPSCCSGEADELLTCLYELQEHNAQQNLKWLKEVIR